MYRGSLAYHSFVLPIGDSDAGRWKTLGVPVVIGVDNLPSPVRIGLTDLTNIGGPVAPLAPPGSGTTATDDWISDYFISALLNIY